MFFPPVKRDKMEDEKLINLVFEGKYLWNQKKSLYHMRNLTMKLWNYLIYSLVAETIEKKRFLSYSEFISNFQFPLCSAPIHIKMINYLLIIFQVNNIQFNNSNI